MARQIGGPHYRKNPHPMSQTPQQQGTTLEVLAPYLPYGIEVEVSDAYEMPSMIIRNVLVGIDENEGDFPAPLVIANYSKNGRLGKMWLPTKWVLPVLKPFSSLTEPLEDGTVPAAIELAKALTYYPDPAEDGEAPQPDWKTAHCFLDGDKIEVVWDEYEPGEGGEEYTQQFTIDGAYWSGHWHSEDGNEPAGPAMIDWLRRHHFAAPVNGRPLLEGIDFIAAASTIEKGEGS